ncbi:MAG: sarcoglycan [Eubacteriales bacterium]|nr:sarcoglycan [Eubacteriales bacterium]
MTVRSDGEHGRRSCYFWLMVFLLLVLAVGIALLLLGLVFGVPPFPQIVTL